MSALLNDERIDATRLPFHYRGVAIGRWHDRTPDRHRTTQIVANEEEMAFVAKGGFALAILGVTPLIVFLILYYFCPDLLRFLDAAAK